MEFTWTDLCVLRGAHDLFVFRDFNVPGTQDAEVTKSLWPEDNIIFKSQLILMIYGQLNLTDLN